MPRKYVYMFATLTAMAIILPFQGHAWALYVGACAGYMVLVFGLRLRRGSRIARSAKGFLTARVLLTHANFLAIVVGWIWLLIALAPHLLYAFRMGDTRRPYFGLAFVGILGLMLLEMTEQRWLRASPEAGDSDRQMALARQGKPKTAR